MFVFPKMKKIFQADVSKGILKLSIYETGAEKPVIACQESINVRSHFLV